MTKSDKELVLPAPEDLEEAPVDNETVPAKITCSVVITYLKTAVIEPYLMLFMFANAAHKIIGQSLFKDKACLNELGYNHTICDNLHSYSDIEDEVQRMTNNYHIAAKMLGILPGIITNLFLSSWSDHYGRKIPLLVATFGIILEIVGVIINIIDFELPIFYMILPAVPSGLFGGHLVIMTACVSFISDDSNSSTRVLRFAFFEFAFMLASPIGTAASGVIYDKFGYLAVYLTSLGCNVTGFILLLFRLKEKREKKLSSFKEAMSSLFSLQNVKANIKTCTKKRDGTVRIEMWLIFLAMTGIILNKMGTHSIEYFFVSKMYNWSNYKLSMVSMVFSFMKGVTVMISVPLLNKVLKVSDITLALVGIVSTLAQTVQNAFAYEEWLYYLASFVGLLNGLSNIGVRSLLSKLVPKEEIGRVFSVMTLFESVTPVIGLTAFAQVYNASVDWFPGFTFLIAATFLVISMAVLIWMFRYATPAPFENQGKSTESGIDNEGDANTSEKGTQCLVF